MPQIIYKDLISFDYLQDTFMLFGSIFDLIFRINFGAKSDQNRIDSFILDNVFNELFAKSLYLLPQSKWRKVVSATGFEPVTH